MIIEKTRISKLEGLLSKAKTKLASSDTSAEQKKVLRQLLIIGNRGLKELKNISKPIEGSIDLSTLIREHTPKSTSDENIEIQKGIIARLLTRSMLRGLGAAAKGLRGFVGRKIQQFKGTKGFWVTSNGRRAFIPFGAKEASKLGKIQAKGPIGARESRKISNLGKRRTSLGQKLQRADTLSSLSEVSTVGRDVLGLMADVLSFL